MNDENVAGGSVFDLLFEAGREQGLDQPATNKAQQISMIKTTYRK